MEYIILDGDDIGLKIERSFMENNESSLKKINEDIKRIVEDISAFLREEGFELIFSGADGIICKGNKISLEKLSKYVRKSCVPYTFSIGIGNSLKDAFISLRYAKSISKNVTVSYDEKDKQFNVFRLN